MRPALRRITVAALAAVMLASTRGVGPAAQAQPTRVPLESAAGLRLHNVSAVPATLQGRKGLRVELSEETMRRLKAMTPEEQQKAVQQGLIEQLAVIEASDFGDGVIEAEIAGAPRADAGEGARGFVGIAFRVQDDLKTYDAFYLRPTNGRADDQVRRNHSTQYISHPDWPWFRLRKEFPEKYEAYVDLVPGEWTKIRIEVQGERAKLFVNGQPQPTLIVNDVKTGARGRGKIALWIDSGTVAHFRDLTVTPQQRARKPSSAVTAPDGRGWAFTSEPTPARRPPRTGCRPPADRRARTARRPGCDRASPAACRSIRRGRAPRRTRGPGLPSRGS